MAKFSPHTKAEVFLASAFFIKNNSSAIARKQQRKMLHFHLNFFYYIA